MSNSEGNLLAKPLSRRSFMKWSAAIGGATALRGGLGLEFMPVAEAAGMAAPAGKWVTAACWHNCSAEASRCLIKAYVQDGVPQRIKTDDTDPDSPDLPQRRACPRGRAQISHVLSADRLKYPMKRKNWAPGGGKKELRGQDEWIRISWDEALDILASETQRVIQKHGNKSILGLTWGSEGLTYWDPMLRTLSAAGGYTGVFGTCSFGGWPASEVLMTGGLLDTSDRMALLHAKLIVLFGANWSANKAGNNAYFLKLAKQAGAKIIVVDPMLSPTAQALADQWIPVRPGTDTALLLGIAHHMIANGLQDQAFLDKYCSGFDKDHMPAGAPAEDNFKDYVLGTFDKQPKTPEWAAPICGVPVATIRDLATQMATVKPATLTCGWTATKIPAGEQVCQTFFTVGWMTGNVGFPGAAVVSGVGTDPLNPLLVSSGLRATTGTYYGDKAFPNPLDPTLPFGRAMPAWPSLWTSKNDWSCLEFSEMWQSILDGKYGRDSWPGGKRPVNIQMIYHGHGHWLNSTPNVAKGIEVHRKVEFVVASCLHYTNNARYADLVFPISSWWERQGEVMGMQREQAIWWQQVMEPLFETKPDMEVAKGLAKRLGLDPAKIEGNPPAQKEYNTLAAAVVMKADGSGTEPLVTITDADLKTLGVTGNPQQGRITVAEFKEKGIYKVARKPDDKFMYVKNQAFHADPVKNPVKTASGKLEIYCPNLAASVNSFGFSKIAPIGKWQEPQDQGYQAAQKNQQYPLILFTPHSLRRAHTTLDNVVSLREAFPQECLMSTVDAEARGLKNGDVVLLTSPHGKVLRHVQVTPFMVPGAVALEDGAWFDIDEATGIDQGGCPNVLQAPVASGQGAQNWNGTLVQVTKYAGELLADVLKPARLPKFAG